MTDTLQAVRERLATAFYNVIPPESHTDSHIWHTYCHTLAEIALQYITTPQAAQEEVVERLRESERCMSEVFDKLAIELGVPEASATGDVDKLFDAIGTLKEQPVTLADYEATLADHRRLVRELDVALNGENAAQQASLCDILAQVKAEGIKSTLTPPSQPAAPKEE